MIDVSQVVFVLEGQSEIAAFRTKLQKEYGINPELRKVSCNGKCVSEDNYASAAAGTIHMALSGPFRFIAVILDRERRTISSQKFAERIKDALISKAVLRQGVNRQDAIPKIVVFVPDRMFENWIVADVDGIKGTGFLNSEAKQAMYDGKNGKRILAGFMNVPYKKTVHAPLLFKAARFDVASRNSPSFSCFFKFLTSG